MKQQSNKIECPNCGHEIDVNEILYHQIEGKLQDKLNVGAAELKKKNDAILSEIKEKEFALKNELEHFDQRLNSSVAEQLNSERKKLTEQLKKQINEEQSDQLALLKEEIAEKSEQVKELHLAKVKVEQLTREKEEAEQKAQLKAEQTLTAQLKIEKEKIQKLADEQNELKLKQKDEHLEQLRRQLTEAQRKAEQGSMQLQGEVQELAIEDWLTDHFPLDTIEEIKKGARGADCLQIVNSTSRPNCGTIYYESKRSKAFQPAWIEKFKNDIREKNADIGVLVTETMPSDMERMGMRDGVWICSFDEFKALCVVLRDSLIRLSTAITIQENKGDKMGMLYDFLTSNEFRLQIEAIVEGFTQMQTDLESEKRAMTGIWKKREKQLQKVLLNTNHMYSSIKGIAGNAVQSVPALELSIDDDDQNDVG